LRLFYEKVGIIHLISFIICLSGITSTVIENSFDKPIDQEIKLLTDR